MNWVNFSWVLSWSHNLPLEKVLISSLSSSVFRSCLTSWVGFGVIGSFSITTRCLKTDRPLFISHNPYNLWTTSFHSTSSFFHSRLFRFSFSFYFFFSSFHRFLLCSARASPSSFISSNSGEFGYFIKLFNDNKFLDKLSLNNLDPKDFLR